MSDGTGAGRTPLSRLVSLPSRKLTRASPRLAGKAAAGAHTNALHIRKQVSYFVEPNV